MKLHPNKGGNTAYFQEMSHLFNKHYKGNNAARIQNTPRRTSPPRTTTRANIMNALLKLKSSVIKNGVRYKVYNWPEIALSSTGKMQAKKTIKRIIPNINTNAYSFKYPTRKRVEKHLKNRNMVNKKINNYFSSI